MSVFILAKIVDYTHIPDRAAIQQKIADVINTHNHDWDDQLVAPFKLVEPDQFYCATTRGKGIFHRCFAISRDLYPVRVRFSIIVSQSFDANQDVTSLTAYKRASEALNRLKREKHYISVSGLDASQEEMVNAGLHLITNALDKHTQSKLEILVPFLEEMLIKDIASQLKKSEQSVYKVMRSGEFRALKLFLEETELRVEEAQRATLSHYVGDVDRAVI